jgi:hypothetical protein
MAFAFYYYVKKTLSNKKVRKKASEINSIATISSI